MIVKCIANTGAILPQKCLIPKDGFDIDTKFYIDVDQYYVIYGMTIYGGYPWYYLVNEVVRYPFWHPAPLFEVTDGRLSRYWVYSFFRNGERMQTTWAYPEWANNPYDYYDRLIDDYDNENTIFEKYKALMDLEFPNPSVVDWAEIYDTFWLGCPFCIDAWETRSTDGMVICPTCDRMLHNPNYRDKLIKLT